MALGKLDRRRLAAGVLLLVTVDAQPGRRGGIVKGRGQTRRYRWSGWFRVAVGAGFLRGFKWLQRLRRMMTDDALGCDLEVRSVVKFDGADRALQQDGMLWRLLREQARGDNRQEPADFSNDLHGTSQADDCRSLDFAREGTYDAAVHPK